MDLPTEFQAGHKHEQIYGWDYRDLQTNKHEIHELVIPS